MKVASTTIFLSLFASDCLAQDTYVICNVESKVSSGRGSMPISGSFTVRLNDADKSIAIGVSCKNMKVDVFNESVIVVTCSNPIADTTFTFDRVSGKFFEEKSLGKGGWLNFSGSCELTQKKF
jgi:hypothetical protein